MYRKIIFSKDEYYHVYNRGANKAAIFLDDSDYRRFLALMYSSNANNDRYLKYLFSYIHLNPIEMVDMHWKEFGITNPDSARRFLMNYEFSSYLDYMEVDRVQRSVLNKDAFPEYFKTSNDFDSFIDFWLKLPRTVLKDGP